MRFMVIRRADEQTEAGIPPSTELLGAMGSYMEELARAGVLLAGEGLAPTSKGALVSFSGGRPTVVDGPFTESKELVAGYALIEVRSKDEAIEWVKRWPRLDGGGSVQLEIRQVMEADDFGEAFTPELREAEVRLRSELPGQG